MQVNLVSGPGGSPPTGSSRELLTPDVLQLLGPPADPQAPRAQELEEQRQERQRRRDTEQREVVAASAGAAHPADVIRQAERELSPGSRAVRQEELRGQAQQQATQQRQDFRTALADAAARERPAPAQPTPRDANAAKPEATGATQSTGESPGNSPNSPAADTANRTPELSTPRPVAETPAAAATVVRSPAPQPSPALMMPETVGGVASRAAQAVAKVSAALSVAVPGPSNTAAAARAATTGVERASSTAVDAGDSARSTSSVRKTGLTQTALTEPDPTGTSDANVERILRLIQTRIGKDRSVATLRLDPPELGMVRLRLDLRDTHLGLLIETQTPAARRLLSEKLDVLRQSLEAAGIQLDRVEMRVPPAPPAEMSSQAHPWAGGQNGTSQHEPGSAGGGPPDGKESKPTAAGEPPVGPVMAEPAAESLVNVWA